MPYGNFYYGKTGFFFKKSGATGARYNPSLGAICNQPQDVNNRFVPGSGVGASSTAQRRAKLIHSYNTHAPQKDGKGPQHLGIFAQGGSNMYALNWGLYNNPYVTPPTVSGTPTIYSIVTGYTQATVYWTAPNNGCSDIRSYTLQYSTDGVIWITIPNVSPTLTDYTITGLSNNQIYYFKILATNSVGNSSYSSATTSLVQNFDSWDLVPNTDSYGYKTKIIASSPPTTETDETGNVSVVIYRRKNYYSSASSVLSESNVSNFYSYLAFQYTNKNDTSGSGYTFWNSSRRYNDTGNYTGSASTTIQGVGTVLGEWMQSQTEFSSAINSYYIQARYTDNAIRLPSTWYIVGSNDNATWNLITSQTTPYTWTSSSGSFNGTFGNSNGLPFTNNVYTYIRIVVPTIFNPVADNPSGVDIWIFRPNALIQNLSPGSPTNLLQTGATSTSITLSFTPSVSYGGAITNYLYSINGGSTFTAFSPAITTGTSGTITGLSEGTSYNIVLRAVNQYDAGTKSSTVSMTTPTRPTAPTTLLLASSYRGSPVLPTNVVITFTPPSSTYGLTITNYQYSINGGTTFANVNSFTTNTATINGLTNDVSYTILLRAVTSAGAGLSSSGIKLIVGDFDNSNLDSTTLYVFNNNPVTAFANAGLTPFDAANNWYVSGKNGTGNTGVTSFSRISTMVPDRSPPSGWYITTTPPTNFYNGNLYYFYIPSTP